MCVPIPTGPEMVQVIKRNSFKGGVLSQLQSSDSRKQEGLVKLRKTLTVCIATASAPS